MSYCKVCDREIYDADDVEVREQIASLTASLAEETAKNEGLRGEVERLKSANMNLGANCANYREKFEAAEKELGQAQDLLLDWSAEKHGLKVKNESLLARLARAEDLVAFVREFAGGRLDYGNITADAARAALLELMFYTMRKTARAALQAWDAAEGGAGDERGKET